VKPFVLECDFARPYLILLNFFYFFSREKYGLVRNDFLDCITELRQARKNEMEGNVQSEKNSNTGATFSKLQQTVSLIVRGYYLKLTGRC
jgi:hypothetical protein